MTTPTPKFRRRKSARPAELVDAALGVFAEKGFAAAKLDDIAARAGVSKGAVYLYFANKEELFRAVVSQAMAPNLATLKAMAAAHPGPFSELIGAATAHLAHVAEHTALGGVVKMVIGEAGNFPELARVWHDEVVVHGLEAISTAIQAAQARGELKPADPRALAVEFIAPLLIGVIWRETFVPIGAPPFDLAALMRQHMQIMLEGASRSGAAA